VITLTGDGLTIDDVESVARGRLPVELSGEARERMAVARAVAERVAGGGERVYGLTTGLGALREIDQRAADAERYSAVTIQAHTTGHGPLVAGEIVRAAMLHRANALARGRSMVRPEVADAYVKALNDGFEPPVHAVGSVGQSDLPAMAEIARGLLEQGLRLEQGEALAMLNANSLSVGQAALAIAGLRRLLSAYDAVAALSLEGFAANLSMLHPEIPDAHAEGEAALHRQDEIGPDVAALGELDRRRRIHAAAAAERVGGLRGRGRARRADGAGLVGRRPRAGQRRDGDRGDDADDGDDDQQLDQRESGLSRSWG